MDRYSQEHLTNFELAGTFECAVCGAVVRDTVQHDEFHEAIVSNATILAKLSGTVAANTRSIGRLLQDMKERVVGW